MAADCSLTSISLYRPDDSHLTRHQIGTVERALAIFQQLGLVEQLDCGLLYMTDIELMIGQSSTEAETETRRKAGK